ncbi:hypothetical protein OS493_010666 [Desmophyllum pertusum]|uniref:Uncharacterized protein n=1 Tax=Desmophyllum pertusum TaxID=174260 RepID=A0A9X0D3T1_9CNID|nr:hypothetical protein OS493_010666 [Desmophyllum pertusum]
MKFMKVQEKVSLLSFSLLASMLDYPGMVKKFGSGATHAITCTSDEEIVSHAVKQMECSDLVWTHLHEAEMFFKEDQSNLEGGKQRTFTDVLQSVDSRIKEIHDTVPGHSLLLVLLGCGDLSLVRRLQRQTQTNRPELRRDLKEAVKITKNGLCFLKITEQC